MCTEIFPKTRQLNKNGLSKARNNLIGHAIFLISEKYLKTNHRTHEYAYKKLIIKSNFAVSPNSWLEALLSFFIEQFIKDQENENQKKKKTQQSNVDLLRNEERVKPKEPQKS